MCVCVLFHPPSFPLIVFLPFLCIPESRFMFTWHGQSLSTAPHPHKYIPPVRAVVTCLRTIELLPVCFMYCQCLLFEWSCWEASGFAVKVFRAISRFWIHSLFGLCPPSLFENKTTNTERWTKTKRRMISHVTQNHSAPCTMDTQSFRGGKAAGALPRSAPRLRKE